MASFTGDMGVSFQDRNPKDGPLPYRPISNIQGSGNRPARHRELAGDASRPVGTKWRSRLGGGAGSFTGAAKPFYRLRTGDIKNDRYHFFWRLYPFFQAKTECHSQQTQR